MKNISKIASMITAVALLSGCYYDNEEYLYPEAPQCDTTEVSFSEHIQPIIDGNCSTSGCHVAGGSGNGIFEGYAGVKAKADNGSLRQRVLIDKNMPPSAPLNSCQLSQIEAWLDAGAPNN